MIVVDDASTDDTPLLLSRCKGIRVIRRDLNEGFVAACNAGAADARGRFLHFLNNDAFPTEGWLRELLATFDADERIGAVVSQLRSADGSLAEAGAVIWADGRGTNYGRGLNPKASRFSYTRDVDYGSAASLMVRADAFSRAGGFSPEFAPAYYEDVDLCFALRAQGYRIVYQPCSVVLHLEGVSYGSNARPAPIALQEKNRNIFAKKWRTALTKHFPPDVRLVERAARRLCGSRCVVILDERVPFTDRSAGSRRMAQIMSLLQARDCHVIFGSMDRDKYPPYGERLEFSGIEVMPGFSNSSISELRDLGLEIDLIWLCRPGPAGALGETFRKIFPRVTIAFDTVDLHYLRLQREERVSGRTTQWQRMRERELALARGVDVTVVTSPLERDILAAEGISEVAVIPIIEPESERVHATWEQRSGIIFTGNYSHSPNEDAAEWLCSEIMPLVWQKIPDVRLTLAGAEPTLRMRRLAGERVVVTGFVEGLEGLLGQHRVFAAPLRFGAGVKGKIVQALANGLPVVTTEIGDEGIFVPRDAGIVVSNSEGFAEAIVLLHQDRSLWTRLAEGAQLTAGRFTPAAVAPRIDEILALAKILPK